MTKKKGDNKMSEIYNKMNREQKKETRELLANWLVMYTDTVIMRVMENIDSVLGNEFAMDALKEMYEREKVERDDFKRSIENLLDDFETFKKYDPHNHVLTHSGSYRNILYDMFIMPEHYWQKDKKGEQE